MANPIGLPVSLPEICAPREKLLRHLDHAAKRQIVHIQAPGGYGKTVSTLLWLKKTKRRAACHCFDEYDNTPALFYLVFCHLLFSLIPQDESITGIVKNPAFRDAPVELTLEILTKADYGQQQVVLILDDFHTINNELIIKSLPYVLAQLSQNVSVFLLSRGELPDTFRVLQDANKVSMVSERELAFSSDEILKHFANYGRFTTERKAEEIRVYSEGWIILINMIAVSGSLNMGIHKSKTAFKDFVEKTFWNKISEQTRQFLLRTCITDKFTLELCEALTGTKNCEKTLDMLVRKNANLSLAGGEYRYHQLFLGFLREKIAESSIDISSLYKIAAEYYLSKNDIMTGRRYAIKSGDSNSMIKAIQAISKFKNLSLDEYVGLANVFAQDQLPDSVCNQMPFLYLPKMFVAFLTGNHQKFECCWDKIYSLFPVMLKEYPQFIETTVTNSILDYRVKFSEFVKHIQAMPAITYKHEIDQVTAIAIQMPFLHRSSRDCYECSDPKVRKTVVNEAFKFLLKYDCDNLFLGIEAGLYIEQNRLDEAQDVLLRAQSLLHDKVSIDLGWATFLMLAETSLLKGNRQEYERYKAQAKDYFESRQALYYNRNFLAYETRTLLWDGDKDTAREWLNNYFVGVSEYGYIYKLYQNFTTARAYIVLGKNEEALRALNKMRAVGVVYDRLLDTAEADVLISVIDWTLGEKKAALDRLYRQLALLKQYSFIRIVANEGKAVLPILSAVIRKMDREADKDEALYRFVRKVYLAAYKQAKRFRGIADSLEPKPIKLSKQQALILELLAKGHKNAQIVELTGISINTVRYHTKIVYQKLEVTNALDAIVKARQLKILQ